MKGENNYKKASNILNILYDSELNKCINKVETYNEYLGLIRLAAYSGNHEAQLELALHYEEYNFFGLNKDYNKKKAVYWYAKSCEGNISDACNNLATIYYSEGRYEEAKFLYRKAVKLGNTIAKRNLKGLV